jgi:hypothetical protein
MKELDKFLRFLMENMEDERISIWKKMKYGYRHYYISLSIDLEDEKGNPIRYRDRMSVTIYNRNNCIELEDDDGENIVFEDVEMVKKWTDILEEYISKDMDGKVHKMVDLTLGKCANKSLHRAYKMKEILKDDEPLQPRRNRQNKQSKGNKRQA